MREYKSIIKLDFERKTYNAWSSTLVSIFRGKNLLDIVDGKEKKPGAEDAAWKKKDNEAAFIIGQTLSPTELLHVNTRDDTAHQMWDKLQKRHIVQMYSAVKNSENKIKNCRYQGNTSMEKHIEYFNLLKMEYEQLGGTKPELDYCQLFLDTLQDLEAWNSFRMVTNLNEMVLDQANGTLVTNKINLSYLQNDALDKSNQIGTTTKKEYSANQTLGQVDLKIFAKRNIKFNQTQSCINCGGLGHQKYQCTSGPRDNSIKLLNTKVYNQNKTNVRKEKKTYHDSEHSRNSASHTHNSKDEAWNTSSTTTYDDTTFLLDNCCTTTIVNDKKYFIEYEEYSNPMQLGTFRDPPGQGQHKDIFGEGNSIKL